MDLASARRMVRCSEPHRRRALAALEAERILADLLAHH